MENWSEEGHRLGLDPVFICNTFSYGDNALLCFSHDGSLPKVQVGKITCPSTSLTCWPIPRTAVQCMEQSTPRAMCWSGLEPWGGFMPPLPGLSSPEGCHRTVPHVLLLGSSVGWLQARSTLQSSLFLGRLCFSHSLSVNIHLFYKCLILSE